MQYITDLFLGLRDSIVRAGFVFPTELSVAWLWPVLRVWDSVFSVLLRMIYRPWSVFLIMFEDILDASCQLPKARPLSTPRPLSQPRKNSPLKSGRLKVVEPSPVPYVVPIAVNKAT